MAVLAETLLIGDLKWHIDRHKTVCFCPWLDSGTSKRSLEISAMFGNIIRFSYLSLSLVQLFLDSVPALIHPFPFYTLENVMLGHVFVM